MALDACYATRHQLLGCASAWHAGRFLLPQASPVLTLPICLSAQNGSTADHASSRLLFSGSTFGDAVSWNRNGAERWQVFLFTTAVYLSATRPRRILFGACSRFASSCLRLRHTTCVWSQHKMSGGQMAQSRRLEACQTYSVRVVLINDLAKAKGRRVHVGGRLRCVGESL